MFLKYFLIALSNIFIFSIGILWNTRMSLLAFILIAYLLPIIFNNIINLSIEGTRNVKIYVITSGITTFCYFIFSIYFISRPGFDYFISENQIDTGSVSIEINTGLANIEQLIFVFLLNFMALFLISLFIRKKDLNVRNKKFK